MSHEEGACDPHLPLRSLSHHNIVLQERALTKTACPVNVCKTNSDCPTKTRIGRCTCGSLLSAATNDELAFPLGHLQPTQRLHLQTPQAPSRDVGGGSEGGGGKRPTSFPHHHQNLPPTGNLPTSSDQSDPAWSVREGSRGDDFCMGKLEFTNSGPVPCLKIQTV